ncbi:dienelactone hydrolase family protein [Novosphingobium sp.]|uniref:dienelactone hydrolase family protein n=1 Tax=Novosphingobium sp. TaxID=1874826 RepID=UPI00286CA073|nr:dienelactone hydrolase family protein [Novosphingobium sp.]
MSTLERADYRDGQTALTGWVARPAGPPRAAVAIFPTIMNPTPVVEAKALALAEAGYLAFVADFYGAEVPDFQASMKLAEALRGDVDAYRQRLLAALTAMRAIPEAAGLPMLAIGFCMGGQAVLELARANARVLAVASFHGLLETGRKADQPITPRILVCHGDADALVPRSHVLAFWEEMDAASANWHFHSYSGVPHGFTNPRPSPATGTVSYDPSADRQSWAAMLGLFDEVLG